MKHYTSTPPKNLNRPAPREPKPANLAMMLALGKALFARTDT
ncbi:hypothetical protein [Streptosporangium sp. NPDC002524]